MLGAAERVRGAVGVPENIRVAALEDHPLLLLGLRGALAAAENRIDLVGSATTASELRGLFPPPDVVLLSAHLRNDTRPADNVRSILELGCRVVVYGEPAHAGALAEAVAAGALGAVLETQPPAQLVEAITSVHAGLVWLDSEIAEVITPRRPRLAPRELEVLRLVAHGLATKQVATRLGLKEETVKEYLKRIRTKYAELGRAAGTRVHLLQLAREDGLLDQ